MAFLAATRLARAFPLLDPLLGWHRPGPGSGTPSTSPPTVHPPKLFSTLLDRAQRSSGQARPGQATGISHPIHLGCQFAIRLPSLILPCLALHVHPIPKARLTRHGEQPCWIGVECQAPGSCVRHGPHPCPCPRRPAGRSLVVRIPYWAAGTDGDRPFSKHQQPAAGRHMASPAPPGHHHDVVFDLCSLLHLDQNPIAGAAALLPTTRSPTPARTLLGLPTTSSTVTKGDVPDWSPGAIHSSIHPSTLARHGRASGAAQEVVREPGGATPSLDPPRSPH